MFGEQISGSPRIASPWTAHLSTSASTSASTTAPPTPPPHHPFAGKASNPGAVSGGKDQELTDDQLPALHLLNMSCDDALSDLSDEADGFFSLDMDVSIDQQLQDHEPSCPLQHDASSSQSIPAIPSLSERFDPSSQRNSREASASPLLNPAIRRASETVAFSSSPLQGVGLDPIMASRSRNSPVFHGASTSSTASPAHGDAHTGSPPSAFGPIAPEVDQKGNLEYKLKILPPSRERFDRLVTQLKWRLLEGGGLAVYEIGVLDDGTLIGLDPDSMKDSLKLLSLMAAEVGADCYVQRVLALEKVAPGSHDSRMNLDATNLAQQPESASRPTSSELTAPESDLSLRALASAEAEDTLTPYIFTADLSQEALAQLSESGAARLYRFDIAEQQASIPPPLASVGSGDISNADIASVAAVDPSEAAYLAATQDDAEMVVSAQTKRRLLKATNSLPGSNSSMSNTKKGNVAPAAPTRTKRDILEGRDQSEIVYLPSKEEKRILRAAAEAESLEAAAAAAERALSHTEEQERKMMAKMTRVADSVQPKTARARARARKSPGNGGLPDGSASTPSYSASPSPTPSSAMKAVNAPPASGLSTGAYTGYENVMSAFGVLSERAARTLYGQKADDAESGMKGRLIVEAVVRRKVNSADNYVDYQGAKSKLSLDDAL